MLSLLPALCSLVGAQAKHPEKVLWTKQITGKVAGFEVGDYVHAVIRSAHGKQGSYFLSGPEVEYFLATHAKGPMKLTVQHVSSYIEEAGGMQEIDRIESAKIGTLDAKTWWARQLKTASFEALSAKYEKLVQSLQKS